MKVSIFATNGSFLGPIEDALKDVDVTLFEATNNHDANMRQVRNLLEWADVAFFDFCHYPLPEATRMDISIPFVARLHGLEVYDDRMEYTNWRRVQTLIMSSPQLLRFSRAKVNYVPIIRTLPIGTNVELFPNEKKTYDHNLCMVAVSMLPRKRLFTALESFRHLLDFQSDWALHIRTSKTDWRASEQEEYSWFLEEALEVHDVVGKVRIYDHMSPGEYAKWLSKMDIFINNSMQEGYCKAAFDAMSSGVYPLIYNWLGAESIFKKAYLFQNQTELVSKIKQWERKSFRQKLGYSNAMHSYVERHHNEEDVGKAIRNILVAACET